MTACENESHVLQWAAPPTPHFSLHYGLGSLSPHKRFAFSFSFPISRLYSSTG